MNVLYKHIILLSFLCLSFSAFAQNENEYEGDLEFKSISPKKEKKKLDGKRKFNVHFKLGYNLSTVIGADVAIFNDTMTAIKNRQGLDSYQHAPTYFPYAGVDLSFNFSRKLSLTIGLNYNKLGWREVAKYNDNNVNYKFTARYDFHYINLGVSLQRHFNKNVSIYGGHTFSLLVKNDAALREIEVYRGDTLTNIKQIENFNQATGVSSVILLPQFFIGTHFGSDAIRFDIKAVYIHNFIHSAIKYSNIAIEAGVIIKLLRDYERKF